MPPISGFDSPSRASRAICRSCAVSSSRVSGGPLAHRLTRRQQLLARAFGECLHADRCELVVGGAELGARVGPAMLAAQPFAVEQMRARQVHAHLASSEAVERLAIVPLGGSHLCSESAHDLAWTPSAQSVPDAFAIFANPGGLAGRLRFTDPSRSLDQLDHRPSGCGAVRRAFNRVVGGGKRLVGNARPLQRTARAHAMTVNPIPSPRWVASAARGLQHGGSVVLAPAQRSKRYCAPRREACTVASMATRASSISASAVSSSPLKRCM